MMNEKNLPVNLEKLEEIAKKWGTPVHLYSEEIMRYRAQSLKKAFSLFPRFQEFFAVKATPTPALLNICRDEGFGSDCSSIAELELSRRVGITGENIMFSSNGTTEADFKKALDLGATLNLDDTFLLERLARMTGKNFPELISFRINPGTEKTGNFIIGNPKDAKFGITIDQVIPAYIRARELGAKRFGLHTMVCSNELRKEYFTETALFMAKIATELRIKSGISPEFINLGGGFGIPYHPDQSALDIEKVAIDIKKIWDEYFPENPPRLFLELGRYITGPAGFLLSRVVSQKEIYKNYLILDATMADFMRPGMYNAYHHIRFPAAESRKTSEKICDIVGSLCENNDKFAIDRALSSGVMVGDLAVIFDTGAHGRAMGFNYNGKLRCGEVLLDKEGKTREIRRRETLEDYFATLHW